MRTTAGAAALLAAGALGLAPAAVPGEPWEQAAAQPDTGVSVLAVSLTAGGVATAVGSGVTVVLARRRDRAGTNESGPAGEGANRDGSDASSARSRRSVMR